MLTPLVAAPLSVNGPVPLAIYVPEGIPVPTSTMPILGVVPDTMVNVVVLVIVPTNVAVLIALMYVPEVIPVPLNTILNAGVPDATLVKLSTVPAILPVELNVLLVVAVTFEFVPGSVGYNSDIVTVLLPADAVVVIVAVVVSTGVSITPPNAGVIVIVGCAV